MIYYNSNTINDWNFGDDNIIKVYKRGAVCYYKITSGDTPTPVQEPCFAVVDDITKYSDTEFEDVYDKATEKWYKLNNLNQYEQYGIYGEGRNITYYEGKLTVDDGYEYIYSGGSWVNLGEVSGSTITIKSPEYIEKDSSHNGKINLDYVWKTNSKMQFKFYSTNNGGGGMIGENEMPDNNDCRMFFASTTAYFDWGNSRISWSSNGRKNTLYEYEYGNYYIKNMVTSAIRTGSTISTNRTNTLYFGQGGSDRFRTYYLKFYDGDTLVKDFIPWTDMNGNYGLFDKVSLSVYNVVSGSLTGSSNVTDVEVGGGYEYPLEYPVKQDPPDNLVFSSMAEAEAYECPWVGMKATIDGDKYVFSGDSQSGYEWVYNPSRLPDGYTEVEYVQNSYSGSNSSSTSRLAIQFEDSITNNESAYTYEITSELNVGNTSAYWDFCGNPYVQLQRTDSGYGNMFEPRAWGKHFNGNIAGTFVSDIKYKIRIFQGVSDAYPIFEITNITAGTTNSYSMTATRSNMQNNSVKFGLFSFYNVSDSGAKTTPAKIYELKIYDRENNLLAHAVPCKRDSDGKVGFYNLARDEFEYDQSGQLSLTAGPVV